MRKGLIGSMAALCLAAPVMAAVEPEWEAGVGVAMMSIPDYRGSDEGNTYLLPIPYFVYNGDWLRVDRSGAHGDLARTQGMVLDLSMNLGPPANSEKNVARAGMPDIDPTIEGGPSLKWLWYENDKRDRKLTIQLPARAVLTTGFEYIGWVFSPHLNMDFLNLGPSGGWNFGVAVGPFYASEKYHDYYYEVRPEFATASRPAYDARGGYSGLRTTLALSKRFSQFWVGGFARYESLNEVVFDDSPLMRKSNSFMAGIGVSWIFARSAERVVVKPSDVAPQ